MIRVQKRKNAPDILIREKDNWTNELLTQIQTHGSFNKLPDKIKHEVTKRYRHEDIKKILIPKEDTKCAFCEVFPNEAGYIEVEHYLPKTTYPKQTYEWVNLLPSCKRCNLKKLSLDTGKKPIVKPDEHDPEDYFAYDNIKIIPNSNSPDKTISKRTIQTLELNYFRLTKPRSELLVSLVNYETELESVIEEYDRAKRKNKKNRLINNMLNSLDEIENLMNPNSKLSGFCKYFIQNSTVMNLAQAKIKAYLKDDTQQALK